MNIYQVPRHAMFACFASLSFAQTIDKTIAPNAANEGIAKSITDEIGAGRGDIYTPNSSAFLINRDPSGTPIIPAQVSPMAGAT
ncbi:MAG: hypothetical protein M3Z23_10670 [Acidobacteriota bacterium]|nr:hypothetical protein [Acidobacteriota bacterium]